MPPKNRNALPCGSAPGPRSTTSLLITNSAVQGLPGDEGVWTATGMGPISHGKAPADTHASKTVDPQGRRHRRGSDRAQSGNAQGLTSLVARGYACGRVKA